MFQSKIAAPGVRVVSVKTDSYKTNVINVSMALPLNEKAATNALLIALLRRSSKKYPDFTQLNAALDELYGASLGFAVSKNGDAQVLSISIVCLDDRFALNGESIVRPCTELLADMIFNPNVKSGSFGKDNLTREKRQLISRILQQRDDKRSYALLKCTELMCPNEPYGKSELGTVDEVENVKAAEVYAAWKDLLKTAVIQVTAVGNCDIDAVTEVFTSGFSKIEREPCTIDTIFFKKGQRFRRGVESFPMNQGKLVIGFRTGTENKNDHYFAERVMIDIFGGGTYSKLFANVREKMSLAYYCGARFVSSKGIAFVQCGIDTDKEKVVSTAIVNQLNEVRQGKFDDELLASSKRSLKESLTFNEPEQICLWYDSNLLDNEIMTPEEVVEGIEQVTKEEVCEAAAKLSIDKIFMLQAVESEETENEG